MVVTVRRELKKGLMSSMDPHQLPAKYLALFQPSPLDDDVGIKEEVDKLMSLLDGTMVWEMIHQRVQALSSKWKKLGVVAGPAHERFGVPIDTFRDFQKIRRHKDLQVSA